jgi:hypothetical protein
MNAKAQFRNPDNAVKAVELEGVRAVIFGPVDLTAHGECHVLCVDQETAFVVKQLFPEAQEILRADDFIELDIGLQWVIDARGILNQHL